ncbi:MAG: hypothetical protein ABW006_09915 [Hyphomicrobium sp.]
MVRYYFDVREGDHVTIDDEGMEFATRERALLEAAQSAAELARDQIPMHPTGHRIVIEARDSEGPILSVRVIFESIALENFGTDGRADKVIHPSAEEVFRLLEAFSLADSKTKAELVALAERLAAESPEFAEQLRKDKTKH